ncbi:MAG TPA: hypothetical protein VMR54_17210 [Thermoanaerobaculia bacterium]|nr:hypothetical protein [Thermoanaerobaculia bacterium]
MAVALLLTTALALAGFLFTSVQGFVLASGVVTSAAAKTLITRHVGYAIPTVLLSLFSQSMVIFYFIGTGKLVKQEAEGFPESERRRIQQLLALFKRRTSPPATFALLSAIGVFVLGGAVHTRALPSWTHLAAAIAAVLIHSWALLSEWRAFGENTALMNDPRGYAKRSRASAP